MLFCCFGKNEKQPLYKEKKQLLCAIKQNTTAVSGDIKNIRYIGRNMKTVVICEKVEKQESESRVYYQNHRQ